MKADGSKDWFSGFLIFGGTLIMLAMALILLYRNLLDPNHEQVTYLVSTADIHLPLPTSTMDAVTIDLNQQASEQNSVDQVAVPTVQPQSNLLPAATAQPGITSGPVVRLMIPNLRVNRVVVPLGFFQDENGDLVWDTNALFATPNRKDLVGQMPTGANPGEGGNVVLVGHNYNRGWFAKEGVFANLHALQPGVALSIRTSTGREYHYTVQQIAEIPWSEKNLTEAMLHHQFLLNSEGERLTLVTCGGAEFWPWRERIYVIATPDF